MSSKQTYTLQDIKDAYEEGYYETQHDLWYREHDTEEEGRGCCGLNPDASVHKPMNEFIEGLNKEKS